MTKTAAEIVSGLQRYGLSSKLYADVMTVEKPFRPHEPIVINPTRAPETRRPDRSIRPDHKSKQRDATVQQDQNRNRTAVDSGVTTQPQLHTKPQPQSQVQPEASNVYTVHARDQLFWCFTMIVRSWDNADIPGKGDRFMLEANEKTVLTERLQKSDVIPWKELKLSKADICAALGASINNKISLDVLRALAFLCEKNIAYVWGKGCCVVMNGARTLPSSQQKWHVIFRKRSGYTLATGEHAVEVMKGIDEGSLYIVEDPNKPLAAASAYKIGELQEIAAKLGVSVMRDGGEKAKLKKDLYQDIVDAIHKID